ncbi:hypothetical protein B0H14DRAFT_2954583, partial [Mycena olivaceomarginata]
MTSTGGVRTLFVYVPLAACTCWTAPLARRLDALDLLGLCLAARVEGGPGTTRVALAASGGSGGNVVALGRTAVREAYADAGVPGIALAVLLPSVCARGRGADGGRRRGAEVGMRWRCDRIRDVNRVLGCSF